MEVGQVLCRICVCMHKSVVCMFAHVHEGQSWIGGPHCVFLINTNSKHVHCSMYEASVTKWFSCLSCSPYAAQRIVPLDEICCSYSFLKKLSRAQNRRAALKRKRDDAHEKVEVSSISVQSRRVLFCYIERKLFIFNYCIQEKDVWTFQESLEIEKKKILLLQKGIWPQPSNMQYTHTIQREVSSNITCFNIHIWYNPPAPPRHNIFPWTL